MHTDPATTLQILLSLCVGVGLSAACGLRVFVPLLTAGLAGHFGIIHLNDSFAWMGTFPALIAFTVATVVEVAAFHIPWIDHFLHLIAAPVALVAGTLLMASVITGLPPFLHWALALIAGGGAAGIFQFLSMGTRGVSTVTTGGLANPALGTAESAGSVGLSVLAILLPVVAAVAVLGISMYALTRAVRFFQSSPTN